MAHIDLQLKLTTDLNYAPKGRQNLKNIGDYNK